MRFQSCIFDCDGTLVDSEPLAIGVIVAMAREYGAHLNYDDALQRLAGTRMADCVAYIEAIRGEPLPEEFVPTARQRIEATFRRELLPTEGAKNLLCSLKVPVGVASNGPRDKIELSLSVTGLRRFFGEHIYSAYEVGYWKPNPELFLHAAADMNVDAHNCLVIEDSRPGVQGALAAGMRVVALRNRHLQLTANELESGNVLSVDSLVALRKLLHADMLRA